MIYIIYLSAWPWTQVVIGCIHKAKNIGTGTNKLHLRGIQTSETNYKVDKKCAK